MRLIRHFRRLVQCLVGIPVTSESADEQAKQAVRAVSPYISLYENRCSTVSSPSSARTVVCLRELAVKEGRIFDESVK